MHKVFTYLLALCTLGFTACTKWDGVLTPQCPQQYMRAHQTAEMISSDYFTGNYIV